MPVIVKGSEKLPRLLKSGGPPTTRSPEEIKKLLDENRSVELRVGESFPLDEHTQLMHTGSGHECLVSTNVQPLTEGKHEVADGIVAEVVEEDGRKRLFIRKAVIDESDTPLVDAALESVRLKEDDPTQLNQRQKTIVSSQNIGTTGNLLKSSFELLRDVPLALLNPLKLASFFGYLKNLGKEIDSRRVEFDSGWEKPMSGVLCTGKNSNGSTIVLSVGIDQKAKELQAIGEVLAKQGYNVFIPDSMTSVRGTAGEDLADADIDDLVAAVKSMQDGTLRDAESGEAVKFFNPKKGYVLMGGSMGGARSIIAAGKMAKMTEFQGVGAKYEYAKAVLSFGTYANMAEEYSYLKWLLENNPEKAPTFAKKWIPECIKKGFTPDQKPEEFAKRSPVEYMKDIPSSVPILIGHGTDDRVILHDQAEKLVLARPENTVLDKDIGGGIHTVMDVLTGENPFRLKPKTFMKKFFTDLWGGLKPVTRTFGYLLDDLKDIVGLANTSYATDKFLNQNLA